MKYLGMERYTFHSKIHIFCRHLALMLTHHSVKEEVHSTSFVLVKPLCKAIKDIFHIFTSMKNWTLPPLKVPAQKLDGVGPVDNRPSTD